MCEEQQRCAWCTTLLSAEKAAGYGTGESSIYNPDGPSIDLCASCFHAEDKLIDEKGTNNLPDQLRLYRENIERYG